MPAIAPSPPAGSPAAWAAAIRPQTLPVAFSPVLVGAAFGYGRTGALDWTTALLALAAALLVQIASNLQNDVGYTVRGGERSAPRSGLPRATAQGWLSVASVRAGIVFVALAAAAIGAILVAHKGWPVLAIGGVSLLAALAYMGGPRPIAYTPYGEATVFVFFGPVAVVGTDWLLTGDTAAATVLAGAALGALAAAALAVNNHRDIDHDRAAGRRTFAALFGARASRALFGGLLLGPWALVPAIAWIDGSAALLLPLLLWPRALRLRRDFGACRRGPGYTALLLRSFRLGLAFAATLAAGAVAARLF